MRAFAILIVSFALAGCATTRPGTSYVAPGITAYDGAVLAADTSNYLRTVYPAANTVLALEAPSVKAGNAVTPELDIALRLAGFAVIENSPEESARQTAAERAAQQRSAALRGDGYAVMDGAAAPAAGVRLRYLVAPLDHGLVLRLQYQGVEASRFYHRNTNGGLVAAAPFTVRETPR